MLPRGLQPVLLGLAVLLAMLVVAADALLLVFASGQMFDRLRHNDVAWLGQAALAPPRAAAPARRAATSSASSCCSPALGAADVLALA